MRHIDVEIEHKEVPAEVQEGDLPPAMSVNLDSGTRPEPPRPFGEEDLKLQKVYQLSTFSDRPEGKRLVRPRVTKGLGGALQKHGHIDGEPFDLEGEVFCSSGQHFSRAGTQVIEHMDRMGVQTISPSNSPRNQTVTYSSDLPVPSAYTPDSATPAFLPWITQPSAGVTRALTSGEARPVERTGRTLANPGASSPTNSELNIESRGGLLLLESGPPPQWGFRAVSSNGLASPEETLGGPRTVSLGSSTLLSGSSACSARKRLRPSGNTAESCSEDQGPSTSKQSCLALSSPGLSRGAHRDTEAGAVPFWKQPKNAADVRRVDRRQKSGLRLKPCRLRRGGRKDTCRSCRPPAAVSHSLLGNFEESILKGRFSPSGRIEGFTAEIGASGSYCPPHATLPVQVTCYDVSEHSAPPPFLGVINLESLGKKGYSTPKVGTIQVTLFNPNKAVVKMFLVRYNFGDMPVNHMTFLRHRIFLVAENEGEGQREGPEVRGMDRKKILCYLIHLSFQSSKSGKIYLHNNIRLLFSRKSSEVDTGIPHQLRSFTEVPKNPKYSPQV